MNVYRCFIHNNQKLETEMSINKWLNCGIFIQGKIQQWMYRTYMQQHGVVSCCFKKLLQVKETKHKRAHTAWFHLYVTLEKTNLIYNDQKEISAFLELKWRQGQIDWDGTQGKFLGWWECSIKLDCCDDLTSA